jgi:hypothetical protein
MFPGDRGGSPSATGSTCCFTVLAIQNNDLPEILGVVMLFSSQFHERPT